MYQAPHLTLGCIEGDEILYASHAQGFDRIQNSPGFNFGGAVNGNFVVASCPVTIDERAKPTGEFPVQGFITNDDGAIDALQFCISKHG
jgi:hypothetical protein